MPSCTDLIFVTNITNYIRGEKVVIWRNFNFQCMTIVGNLKISPHVEKFWESLRNFWKILEILPHSTRFHVEKNWAQKYICREKMTNIRFDPARCWGISKGQFPFMPLGFGQIRGGGGWGAFSMLKKYTGLKNVHY